MNDPIHSEAQSPLVRGAKIIAEVVRTLPETPGVYRMIDARGKVLYVGKAKALKRRVVSYTRIAALPIRLQRMVAATAAMEIIVTHTEAEALLLECNLIKKLKPHYNILLRDDKSFPYIRIARDGDFPRITKYRGARDDGADYFGPFASAGAVNQTLSELQKVFLLRTCTDASFALRTRPCLLHQIRRCSAPCVGRIDKAAYAELVDQARAFLSGKSRDLSERLAARMEEASARLAFEEAAFCRDRIRALSKIQAHQDIDLGSDRDLDVLATASGGGFTAVYAAFFRAGRHTGSRAFFPERTEGADPAQVLSAFAGQFYAAHSPPPLVLTDPLPEDAGLLAEALSLKAGHKVTVIAPRRGVRLALLRQGIDNAREALARKTQDAETQRRLLAGVAGAFALPAPPVRIEVYDNSHIQGTHAVGAMIVAGPEGFVRNAYRTFNIKDPATAPGDDFAMMREVLSRRFARLAAEDADAGEIPRPDLVLIDGGAGQLHAAAEILHGLGIAGVALAAIAKGPDRDAGREEFHLEGRPPFRLPPGDPVLYYLERLRDEAHRFAVTTHRAKRSRAIAVTPLDAVPGIGAARKKALLFAFGSARGAAEAGIEDLAAVPGISRALAERLYRRFHDRETP